MRIFLVAVNTGLTAQACPVPVKTKSRMTREHYLRNPRNLLANQPKCLESYLSQY